MDASWHRVLDLYLTWLRPPKIFNNYGKITGQQKNLVIHAIQTNLSNVCLNVPLSP